MIKKMTASEIVAEVLAPAYTHRMEVGSMPKYPIPEHGAAAEVAERLIHDELMLDGNARLNLATFVTTWMEPEAENLMAEAFNKNMIDEVPYTVYDVSDRLRYNGWQVPAYTMPDNATDVAPLRIVVREGFTLDLASSLINDLRQACDDLQTNPPMKSATATGFAH